MVRKSTTYKAICNGFRFFGMLALCASPLSAMAHMAETDSIEINLFFRQNHTVIDPAFGNNAQSLEGLYSAVTANDSARVLSVDVHATASPEGSAGINRRLSELRAHNSVRLLSDLPGIESAEFSISADGVDWKGLANNLSNCKLANYPPRSENLHFTWIR